MILLVDQFYGTMAACVAVDYLGMILPGPSRDPVAGVGVIKATTIISELRLSRSSLPKKF